MTSTKSSNSNPILAQSTSRSTTPAAALPSYASAAKVVAAAAAAAAASSPSPAVATSSISSSQSPALAIGNIQAVQHNGKTPSISSLNGRAPPAVPVVSTPAIAHSNGAADHTRKASVTIAQGFPNGGPVGGASSKIQFGSLPDSPAITNSTPQIAHSTSSAPIPIPNQNPRVVSPAQSPSPIPQTSQVSGGARPLQSASTQASGMIFGSLNSNGDSDRSRQGPPHTPVLPPAHMRQSSAHDMNGPPGSMGGRGGFQQGGRGRGGYSNYAGNNNMSYNTMGPGGPQYRGGQNQGRGGGMPPPFQSQGRPPMQYPNSPHQAARSPALANAMPGTPSMGQSMPMQPQPQYGYQGMPQYQQAPYNAFQYDPATGARMNAYGMYPMNYPQMGQIGGQMAGPPPQSPQQAYQSMSAQQGPYVPGQYGTPAPQTMSRSSSQISERPTSSTGHPQQSSALPPTALHSQLAPKPASSAAYTRPKKSAAIQIKRPDGEVVEVKNLQVGPASPAPAARTSTPPVVVSSPTPPPKPMTPQVVRTDTMTTKTAEQKISEFKSQMLKAVPSDAPAAEAKTEEAKTEEIKADEVKVDEVKTGEVKSGEVKTEEVKTEDVEPAAEAKQAAGPVVMEPSKAQAEQDETSAKGESEAQAKKELDAKAEAAAAKAKEDEAELERQIREMEEEDLRREAAAAAYGDRKLKEAEVAMQALEDEKQRKRLAAESLGAGKSEEAPPEAPKASPPKTLASKLSNMTLASTSASLSSDDGAMGPPPPKLSPAGEKRVKPAALNLAPLHTKPVEAPQLSAALQSLKSARFLNVLSSSIYPPGIASPNPALNPAVAAKGKSFKYDKEFLLQFQKVFTEKPSVEFESQIKALIGDNDGGTSRQGPSNVRPSNSMGPRGGSNRNTPGNPPIMGSYVNNNIGGKTLPPGNPSQGYMSMGMPRPQTQPFGRATGFGGTSMNRVPSASHMGNQVPQSPRQANNNRGSQRNNSKRADTIKDDVKTAKTMPLTAGMDLKPIAITSNGWKPSSIGKAATGAAGPAPGAAGGHMQPDMVQRKVKAALNKMTPENFDKISDQILSIAAQSRDEQDGRTLRQIIQLTFEKATDEAHWASMYAKFCRRMLDTMSADIRDESIHDKNGNVVYGGNLFRKYLLNRCQEDFERGWKSVLPPKPDGDEKAGEAAAMLSDDYYVAAAAKRRGLGLVQFIGELYKLNMLTERIMHECVQKLVDCVGMPDEAEIESLTKLLKTIGANLDSTEKGGPLMDVYFARIQEMIVFPELPSRLQFMLMDIVDLRKKGWHSKGDNKGPKTLDEIRIESEAAAARKAAENSRPQRGGGGPRMQMGRGDGRHGGGGFNMPPTDHNRNTVGMDDLRRLQGTKSNRQSSGPGVFGPTHMFAPRSSSGRKMGGSMRGTVDNSGASSRTGTPPQQASANAFSLLADMTSSEGPEHSASPSHTNATPAAHTENES